jgi:hypothetical protein
MITNWKEVEELGAMRVNPNSSFFALRIEGNRFTIRERLAEARDVIYRADIILRLLGVED